MAGLPAAVKIVEVGPRDGLQNEPATVPTEVKAEFGRRLAAAGFREVEATSFVHPQRVPQLADAEAVLALLPRQGATTFTALVPNERGLERALAAGVRRIALFTAASETFTQKNIGMSVAESLRVFGGVARRARENGLSVRGYVSTAWVCPYEGEVAAEAVLRPAEALLEMGADEVSLGETLGVAVPAEVEARLELLLPRLPRERLALHFHDTSGTALANVVASLRLGLAIFDSSAGGLGGCPYAPGAAGNLATEDLVYLLDRMGIASGVSLPAVAAASAYLEPHLSRPLSGKQYRRLQARSAPHT